MKGGTMKPILTLAATIAMSGAIAISTAQAAPVAPQSAPLSVTAHDLLQPVHYPYWRCRAWRRECAVRWGWGTWRFQRCMARHAC
jgi:hypothetical protein